jgi:hypothetical protein
MIVQREHVSRVGGSDSGRQVKHEAGSEQNHCVLMYHTETPLQHGCGKMMHVHKNHMQVCCTFTTINIPTGMWLAAGTGEYGTIMLQDAHITMLQS